MFPDKLKIAKVVPVFKSEDKTLLNNYRPISILPVFSKIFERLMYNRLLKHLDNNNILCEQQYGFREKRSTYMALTDLVDRVVGELESKRISLGIFIDLSNAFDTLNYKIL